MATPPSPAAGAPVTRITLRHPTDVPVPRKVRSYAQHPVEGPPVALLTGGSGARRLSQTLIRYTHNSAHILPVFDDGGSSRVLRERFGMPPPGDLRNRLTALSDMTMEGNAEVNRLFQVRLPREGTEEELAEALVGFLDEQHPRMARIEPRYRRIIIAHLARFHAERPRGFDLRGGNIGNFVIAGAYLSVGDLESVIFEFSALAAVRGEVIPVCAGGTYHLMAELADGGRIVGQSRITGEEHAPIRRLAVVERQEGAWREVHPELNPLAARAIRRASLVAYTMGSFYTSVVSNLLVRGVGRVIRETRRPKLFVPNLRQDRETRGMRVSDMVRELYRYLRSTDPDPGPIDDYLHYVLVSTHGESDRDGRVPVDLDRVAALGVEPIVLPLEDPEAPEQHDPTLVAEVLLSLC